MSALAVVILKALWSWHARVNWPSSWPAA